MRVPRPVHSRSRLLQFRNQLHRLHNRLAQLPLNSEGRHPAGETALLPLHPFHGPLQKKSNSPRRLISAFADPSRCLRAFQHLVRLHLLLQLHLLSPLPLAVLHLSLLLLVPVRLIPVPCQPRPQRWVSHRIFMLRSQRVSVLLCARGHLAAR